jgi:eukaryotic-like serine/threonine-protein kinase
LGLLLRLSHPIGIESSIQLSESNKPNYELLPTMSYCFNPNCPQPQNQGLAIKCNACGSKLLLKDRYRAQRFLDSGGMSRNFVAIDTDMPEPTLCAVKQFFPAPQVLDDPEAFTKAIELFQREGEQLSRLGADSNHIPQLYAYLEQEQRFYLVQEFIDGENLWDELSRSGAYNELKIRKLLDDLLPILKFIHDRDIIHRDIKPENIMRRKTGELVLIDFGMSKHLNSTIVSSKGTTGGTIGYAPPEQVRAGVAYPASDIYALGATCAHLLTDVTPDRLYDFQTNKWMWRSQLESQNGKISNKLAEIIDRMLKPDVSDRYPSIVAIQNALDTPFAPSVIRARKWTVVAGIMTGIIGAATAGWLLRDPISCYFGGYNSYCPQVLVLQQPKKLGDVVYYPYLSVRDNKGNSAEFNMAILSDNYQWKIGSDNEVISKQAGKEAKTITIATLAQQMAQKGDIYQVMENPNRIVAIGAASCEGAPEEEQVRAGNRAKIVQSQIVNPLFKVKEYRILNLGQFSRDKCSNIINPQETSFQRSLIIVGMRRISPGLEEKSALYARLSKTIPNLNLNDYSMGTKDKFKLE